MKKIFSILCMAFFFTGAAMAQVGFEGLIIENYYVANAADVAYSDPGAVDPLPAGAVTYRVHVDMAPGWELQAIYAATNVGTGEVDSFVVRSTAPFWNHMDRGDLFGYNVAGNQIDENTVALDSWFTTNRPSANTAGVLEVVPSEDTNGSTPTFPHNPATLLINTDPLSGLPLTTEDGAVPSSSTLTWTPTPGFDAALDALFGTVSYSPVNEIVISDGAFGVTAPLTGTVPATNRVLIGQFTTAGVFSGKFNIQIREIATGTVEQYVAETPGAGQFTHPSLTWGPNAQPTVTITAPTEGQNFTAPATVNFDATASDTDGSIASVQFYLNGVAFGAPIPGPGPYSTTWPTGIGSSTNQLIAVATDNDGATSADTVNFTVTGNPAPVVNLTAPNTAVVGSTVNISATATDLDGIASVQFFFNNSPIGAPIPGPGPYMTSFTATPVGSYTGLNAIRATAIDGLGISASDSENLTVTPNAAPTVSITSPSANAFVPAAPLPGPATTITVNANDTDGTVAQVEFFVNAVSIGVVNSAPFSIVWSPVYNAPTGANTITAVVTDNLGATGNSLPVAVFVINPSGSPYVVESVSQDCIEETVCMPIRVVSAINDVIGFDMIVEWDNTKIYPTGNVIKSGDMVPVGFFETDNSIDLANSKMLISVFLNTQAPIGTSFDGVGTIVCVEFAKRPAFSPVDTSIVEVTRLQESYFNGIFVQPSVTAGTFTTFKNTVMTANVEFWQDQSPIGNSVPVTIQANNSFDCDAESAGSTATPPLVGPVSNTNAAGEFTYDLVNGLKISIGKDIAPTTDVQEVVNGFDALLTRRLIIDDISFVPSVFQVIAMDVNRDGVVSAGDVSQINQRAVLILNEFRQQWNYNLDGTPKAAPAYSPSKDWVFIDNTTVTSDFAYFISSSFPADNLSGYSKQRVPKVPFCLNAPVSNFATCPIISDETYTAIMYGDVNGNYKNSVDVDIRSADVVKVGVGQALRTENFVDVPVTFNSIEDIYAVDLNLDFDANKLAYHSVIANGVQALGHYNENDSKLRITSNSLDVLKNGEVAFMIRFTTLTDDAIEASDINAAIGYLNGEKANVDITPRTSTSSADVTFNVFPNPTSDFLYIGISKDVTAEIMDMSGRVMISNITVSANSTQRVDVSSFPVGLYTIRVFGNDYTSAQRVFVGK